MITSLNNRKIIGTSKLHNKKYRYKEEKTLIEGITLIEEALNMGIVFEEIFYIDSIRDVNGGEELLEKIKGFSTEVSHSVYKKLSNVKNPQGVIGIIKFQLKDINEISLKGNYIMSDEIQDPGNLGTIIRSIDAFNSDGLIINSGTVDPFSPRAIRASMGSVFRVPIYLLEDNSQLEELKIKGFKIIITDLNASKDLDEINFDSSIIVLGNEANGVSEDIREITNEKIKINMTGKAESLNVAIAGSIILHTMQNSG